MTTYNTPASPCFCHNFRNLSRTLTHFYDQELAASGLRITQYALLRRIQALESASMLALTEATGLERTTLVRNLTILARDGLIAQHGKTPSGAAQVRLTPAGAHALTRAEPLWHTAQAKLGALLSEQERAVLPGIMRKLQALA